VHYWAYLQLVHGFCYYDNIAPHILAIGAHDSIAANVKCKRVHATRSVPDIILQIVGRFSKVSQPIFMLKVLVI